jgi:hypothetical protein
MSWSDFWKAFTQALTPLPQADTKALRSALVDLQKLVPQQVKETEMSTPTGMVQIAQADLDNFTSEITAAVGVLKGYIAQLLANQATPLPAADETELTAAVAALDALEPPAPAPSA